MATIRDVSKLAGVSTATVSRVINQKGYVNKETLKKVKKAMETLNYSPNNIARGLAGSKTYTLAFLVSDILNPFFPEIVQLIEEQASHYGYTVILFHSKNNSKIEEGYLRIIEERRVDGVIVASYTIQAEQIMALEEKNIPVVALDRSFGEDPVLSFICKNREGAEMAVKHLIEQGCDKIGHISGPLNTFTARERAVGFEHVYKIHGNLVPSLIQPGDFHIEGGYKAMKELIKDHPDIEGVFAGNDLMAIGAIKALNDLGKSVPHDIKIVGFDDISISKMFMPELSTIRQPVGEMVHLSMSQLMDQINEKEVTKQVVMLDVELIKRQSTSTSL